MSATPIHRIRERRSSAGDLGEYRAFVRRILRAYSRRVAAADPEDLALLLEVAVDVDRAIDQAVAGLRRAGFSWAQIAAATGVTKQAAHERWRHNEGGLG